MTARLCPDWLTSSTLLVQNSMRAMRWCCTLLFRSSWSCSMVERDFLVQRYVVERQQPVSYRERHEFTPRLWLLWHRLMSAKMSCRRCSLLMLRVSTAPSMVWLTDGQYPMMLSPMKISSLCLPIYPSTVPCVLPTLWFGTSVARYSFTPVWNSGTSVWVVMQLRTRRLTALSLTTSIPLSTGLMRWRHATGGRRNLLAWTLLVILWVNWLRLGRCLRNCSVLSWRFPFPR